MFCYRIQASVEIEYRVYNESVGIRLADFSRRPTSEYIDLFDIFIYSEDDMLMTWAKFNAWVHETRALKDLLPTNGDPEVYNKERICSYRFPCYFNIGFLRVQKRAHSDNLPASDSAQWYIDRFLRRFVLDEAPVFLPTCISGQPYVAMNNCKI